MEQNLEEKNQVVHSEGVLFRLLAYMRPYKREYFLGTLYSLLNKFFDIFPEVLIGVAVDVVVKRQDSWLARWGVDNVYHQLLLLGVLTLFIWGFESLFQFLHSIKWRNLAQTVQHSLRLDVYDHVQSLDIATLEKKSTGNLLSILNDDVNQLERFLENGVNQIIQLAASTLIIGAIFLMISPSISLVAIVPIPLIIWGAFFFQNKLSSRFLAVREAAGKIAARLANNLSGLLTIKSFVAQDYEKKQVEKESIAYQEANRHAIVWSSMITPVIRICILLGFLSTLVYGGLLTLDEKLEIGAYSILIFLTQRLLWPMTTLAEITVNYERSMASAKRIFQLLDTPIHLPLRGDPISSTEAKQTITYHNITFSYDTQPILIKDLNLTIPFGKTVAFVGTSGAGKTTLMKLLLRFYHPTEGSIFLGDKDIHRFDVDELRKHIGLVSQDVFLFEGTIFENIAYGAPKTPKEQVIKAAQLAEAHSFIQQLPQGYDTLIGERGQTLSGGQRQRLSIARALLRDPPILIFDEATSSVDNETEMAIQQSLQHIIIGRTTLLIAHRLSTVRHADTIFVMGKGKILEQGSHKHLVEKKGVYAALWALQTGQHSEALAQWRKDIL